MKKVRDMKMMLMVLSLIMFLLSTTNSILAQPSWVKKATKSVFTVKTFNADGTLIGSSNGFFTGEHGEAVSSLTPFKGATRAVVIDAAGKELPVLCVLGANDIYDVVKFRVDAKKTTPLTLAADATAGSACWLLLYREVKNLPTGNVMKVEQIQSKYQYYTLVMTMPDNAICCPLLNEAGEAIGLMQQPAAGTDTLSFAVSALLADSLHISGLSINDPVLRSIGIKKDLPNQLDQANLTAYIAATALDSTSYAQLIDDFVQKFPNAADGYIYRAQLACNRGDFTAADHDMQQAIKVAENKDEAHFSFSRLIYQKELYMSNQPYEAWSLDKSLDEVRQAISINPLPGYRQHEGHILFAQRKYDEASNIYQILTQSDIRSAELFFEAAQCKLQLADTTAQLALLDSAVAIYSRPYLKEAAPYLLARAQARAAANKFREAYNDYVEYEQLMQAQLTSQFYYMRYQTCLEARMYQLALNDISRAIQMEPSNGLYYAEKASLEIRVSQFDAAIATANECISAAPENSDGYLFLGLALCLKGDNAEGVKQLEKARELGDEQATELIEKYSH